MKKLFLLSLLVILSITGNAQTLASYGFSAFTGTYTTIAGTTAAVSGGTGIDDAYSNTLPIGFTFTYCGTAYTTFSVSWNGWITLGHIVGASTTYINDLSNAHAYNLPRPILAALWTDLYYGASTQVSYTTTGAVGSRTCTIQWDQAGFFSSATAHEGIQIILYEGSNIIDFVYKDISAGTYSSGCAIGITNGSGASVTGAVQYWSLNNASAAPTRSMTVETTTIGTQPATNQVYRWSPCNNGTITGTAVLCAGTSTNLSDAVTGGTWASSTTSVATVSSTGVVTGVAGGTSTITYNTSVGCYTVATVTVNPTPLVINGTKSVCSGSTTTLTDATGAGTWTSGTTATATVGSATGVVTGGATAGTANITYTITSSGCYTVTLVTVNPTPAAITGTFSVCAGSTTALTDATGSGTWSSTGTATVSATGDVTGVSAGTATITYTIAGGCNKTAVVTVNPQPSAIVGNAPVCQTFTITLSDGVAGGIWSSSATGVATISTAGVVTGGGTAGTSTISYTIGGCAASTVITVNTQPAAITGTFSICNGSSTLLTDVIAGGVWSSTATGVAGVGTDGTVTGAGVGTSTISYLIGSCVATQVVTVNAQPTAILGAASVCQTFTITLSDATAGGTWSSSATGVATISTAGVVTGGGTVGTSVITYAIGSCYVTTVVTVNIQPAAITGSTTVCEGSTTLLSDVTAGGIWSSTTTGVATIGTDGTLTGAGVGTSTISYLIGTCVAKQVVTVNTQPTAILGTTSVCQTFTITLSDAIGGGTWSSSATGVATISTAGVVTGGGTVGTSTITYAIGSCYVTTVVTVNVQPAAITGATAVCEGSTTLLSDVTAGGIWSSTTTGVATIGTDGTVSGGTVGTTTISYLIGSCVAKQIETVTATPVTITGNVPVCQTLTIQLSDATGGGVWSSVTTGVATISTSGVVTGGGTAGTSVISYTIGSCAATTIVTVNTQPTAILGALGLCKDATTTLSDATGVGTWSSTPVTTASVTATGVVTGVAVGTATITYTLGTCFVTAVVTVNTQPLAITGNTGPICQTFTEALSDATGGGVWSSSVTGVATISTAGVVTGGGTVGTSVISYAIGSCAVTTVVTVAVQPAAITGTFSVCQGLTTALSDVTTTGVWSSTNAGVGSISTTGVVTGETTGTTTISYTIGTCAAKVIVTVQPLPAVITGTKSVCAGLTTSLFDGTGGGTWSSSNTAVATVGASTGIVTGSAVLVTSTATITYTIGSGCINTTVVTVNPVPVAISGANSVCLNATTTLSDATGGGTWSSNNSTIASVSSAGVVTGNNVGVTTITYTLPTGCLITTPMTVNALPSGITGPNTVCPLASITLSDATAGGTWSSSNTGIATVTLTTGVVTGVASGTVNIIYTSGSSGCTVAYAITVNPAPAPVITPLSDTTFCPGGFVALTANIGAGLGYQWYVGGSAISGAVSSSYIATLGGNYQVMETNTFGCNGTSIPMLVAIDTPTAVISVSGGTTICAGFSVTIDANTGVGYSYQWLQDGAVLTGVTGSSYTTSNAGDYTVIVTNATGCSATSNDITISVNPSPTANITLSGPLTFCQNDSVVMTTDYGVDYTYQWYDAAGAIADYSQSYTATTTGVYYVIVSNSYGCTATSVNMSVLVNPLPDVSITASGSTIFCIGGSVTLSATAVAGDLYQWYRGGTAIAGATTSNYVATIGGGYRVMVTDPTTGCSDETHADTTVTVVTTPVVVPLTPASFCWGGSVLLSTSLSGASGTVTYQWYFNGAVIPGATGPTYNTALPGNYSVQITIPGSCTVTTLAVPVTEHPLPDPLVSYYGGYFHTAPYYVTYQWYKDLIPMAGATLDSMLSAGPGNYKVAVTDTFGCQSYSDVYVFTGSTGGSGGTTGVNNTHASDIRIYPNPAQTMVHIQAAEQLRAVITSVDGRTVLDVPAAKDIDVSTLANGIYMIKLYDNNGQMLKAEKLVKSGN